MEENILVPRIIYESIENVFEAQIRKLAIDIAKTLNVNEKTLLQELKKDKISVMLLDESVSEDVDSLKCKAYDKYDNVYLPCEAPIVYKKEYCIKHMMNHTLKSHIKEFECLIPLIYQDIKYYRDTKNRVYDSNFKKIGYYNSSTETIVALVVVGEESEK